MSELSNSSAIGRLLEEISWEGAKVRGYRSGGRGLENVMTTEVLMLLDFLPRRYMAAVLAAAHGPEAGVTQLLAAEVEEAKVTLLPGDIRLAYANVNVQPDATISSPTCFALVESKRVKRASFQPHQLAREYVALMQEVAGKSPLLLLILGEPPPVTVKGRGRVELLDAVAYGLDQLTDDADEDGSQVADMLRDLPARLAWVTWSEIQEVVRTQLGMASGDASATASERRLASALITAVDWHS